MNYTVKTVRCHVAGNMCGSATTIEAAKHKVQMQILPVGVLVKEKTGNTWIIPFPNITHIQVEDNAEKAPKK